MLGDPLVVQKYDRTTGVNFTKVQSTDTAKFVSSANSATDVTTLEVRYARGPSRRLKVVGEQQAAPYHERKANVKVTRNVYNTSLGIWDTVIVNLTWTFPSAIDTSSAANLKDLIAYAAFVPLTATTITKLLNEEV